MNDQTLKDRALWIAISHHLSEWDNELTDPQMVLDAVINDLYELITPWEPFEAEEPECLADYIISMATDIYDLAKDYKGATA